MASIRTFVAEMGTTKIMTVAMLALGIVTAGATSTDAAVIASYPFTTNSDSTDLELNSTAQPFAYFGGGARSGSGYAVQTYQALTSTSESAAISNGDYFSFTVAPSTGYELDLTNLTFTTNVESISSGIVSGGTFFVRSSVDGYGSNLASYTMGDVTTTVARDVTLSAAAFQNLAGPTEFRVYIFKTSTSTTSFDGMRVDSVVLNGDVAAAVPEPTSCAMVTMLTASALLARRQHRHN